jgi:hypothetical protein
MSMAAFAGSISKLSMAMDIVGKPMPEMPLTAPAIKNTRAMTNIELIYAIHSTASNVVNGETKRKQLLKGDCLSSWRPGAESTRLPGILIPPLGY